MSRKPAITVSRLDLERIEAMLDRMTPAQAATHAALREELDRATVLEPAEMPRNVVTMNSTVSFTDEAGGEPTTMTSASSASRYELVPPPAPKTVARPTTLGACQVRLQESMLFEPIAARMNF